MTSSSTEDGRNTMSKIEFDVKLTCESCSDAVKTALAKVNGIHLLKIDVPKQSVLVETTLPSQMVIEAIESSGRKAILKGYGSKQGDRNLGCAVAEMKGTSGIKNVFGVVRFYQIEKNMCVIDGTIDGLVEGEHGLHIHEYGDLSEGCNSLGSHYNPTNSNHGGPLSQERHYGDLGNIQTDASGRASFRIEDDMIKVWDIIGRSLAVSSDKDDLGCCDNEASKIDGNSGSSLACAIIARSAGLFENPKRLCQCDGVSVWDERNVPSAGQSRSSKNIN